MQRNGKHQIKCYEILGFESPEEQPSPSSSDVSLASLETRSIFPTREQLRAKYRELIQKNHPDIPKFSLAIAQKMVQEGKRSDSKKIVIEIPENYDDALNLLEDILEKGGKPLEQTKITEKTAEQKSKTNSKTKASSDAKPTLYVSESFKEIHFAFETLSDPRKRFIYYYPSAGYFDIKLPGKLKKRKQKSRLRRLELWNAINSASINEKLQAFAASVLYGLSVTLLSLSLMAIAPAAVILSLFPLWFAPNLVPNFVAQYYGVQQTKASRLTKLALTVASIIATPFVALAMLPVAIYSGAVTGRHAYKELAARGMTQNQKIALAMGVVALTVGLLILFPPAGLATALSTGGWVAATLGMANFTLPGFAAGAAGVAAAAVAGAGIFMKIGRGIVNCFKYCCCPQREYPSLAELQKQGLYQPRPGQLLATEAKSVVPSQPQQDSPRFIAERLGGLSSNENSVVAEQGQAPDEDEAQAAGMSRNNSDSQLSSRCSVATDTPEFVEEGLTDEEEDELEPAATTLRV